MQVKVQEWYSLRLKIHYFVSNSEHSEIKTTAKFSRLHYTGKHVYIEQKEYLLYCPI